MSFHVGYSTGKDSSVVLNASIEAMRRCLENGEIEADRPLVVITVDTLLEPSNIQMYVPYAHNQVKSLCEEIGINIHLKLVSPPMHQQLMVLYAGSQKLISTSASGRRADCSVIWKVDTAKRALDETIRSLPEKYRNGKWVNLSGVRLDESTRRKSNMKKRGEANLSADMLVNQLRTEVDGFGYYRFAPIANWATRDVINSLNHAGETPMKKMPPGKHIPCYGKNFGLLLAIYGEGSNDVCQAGDSSSCGGVARYGCQTCGMVTEDYSGREMLQYPRWGRFGDDVLRFRDYLVRTSSNTENRAFHPRATCSVTSNVYLQPNVLKATILENMIYQAAQITEKHRHIHAEFVKQYEKGGIADDVGVKDITDDATLRDDVKKDYIAAYIERLREKPMLELFTEKHAVMLSALWSLHGVKSAPYRPMKILDNVRKGHRKPLPPLNSELNVMRSEQDLLNWDDKETLNKEIPDALVYQLFAPARKFDQSISNMEELSHWMPLSFTNSNLHHMAPLLRDLDNALIHRDRLRPANNLTLKVKFSTNGKKHQLSVSKLPSMGKLNLNKDCAAYKELVELAQEKLEAELTRVSEKFSTTNEDVLAKAVSHSGSFAIEFHTELPFAKEFTSAYAGVSKAARSRKSPGMRFTRRKRTKNKEGKFVPGRTSLQDYNPSEIPQLVEQHQTTINYWLPDNKEFRAQQFSLYDYDMDPDFVHNLSVSMDFDESKFQTFMRKHWKIAIARHDEFVRKGFSSRMGSRKFEGTDVFHSLMKSSGLNMAPRFQDYVNRSLLRTEIFHASKLFNLSDRTFIDVKRASHVISINEHRKQKANQLLAIRRARNLKRQELKSILNNENPNFLAQTVIHRVIEFLSHYEEQAFAATIHASHQGMTNKQCLSSRGNANQMWIQEFGPIAADFRELLKMVTSPCERVEIQRDFTALRSVFNAYKRKTEKVLASLKIRTQSVVDCLEEAQEKTAVNDFIDDGMGNMELVDESKIHPVVEAYLSAGATRNRFLTEMGISNVLAASKGLLARDKRIAAKSYEAAIANLNSVMGSFLSKLQAIDYDAMIRKVVTLECRASTIPRLSQSKIERLAALRTAN